MQSFLLNWRYIFFLMYGSELRYENYVQRLPIKQQLWVICYMCLMSGSNTDPWVSQATLLPPFMLSILHHRSWLIRGKRIGISRVIIHTRHNSEPILDKNHSPLDYLYLVSACRYYCETCLQRPPLWQNLLPVIYSVMCFNKDWRYQFTLANNFCLLGLIWVAKGYLDELQKAAKYPIRWSL